MRGETEEEEKQFPIIKGQDPICFPFRFCLNSVRFSLGFVQFPFRFHQVSTLLNICPESVQFLFDSVLILFRFCLDSVCIPLRFLFGISFCFPLASVYSNVLFVCPPEGIPPPTNGLSKFEKSCLTLLCFVIS